MAGEQHLPWSTGPSDAGYTMCRWCDRAIYLPAVPCSTEPVAGLLRMKLEPGFGARCQYELSTRRPDEAGYEAGEAVVASARPYPRPRAEP